jgi:hypothetical protein
MPLAADVVPGVPTIDLRRDGPRIHDGARQSARTCRVRRAGFYVPVEKAQERRTSGDAMNTQDREEIRSSQGMQRGTGRDRDEWFAVLDDWGAVGRPYREIADWLTDHHRLSSWWAQKLIVEYEQARGVRDPGVRPDGTFSAGASKTVAAPVERAFAAFVDPQVRERWLPGVTLRERTSRPGRSARFDWQDGETRLNVGFIAEGGSKSQVAVEHERLPDAEAAQRMKVYWRERLAELKTLLES